MTVTTTAAKIRGYLPDAPSDGSQYARKDGTWAVVSASGGTSDHGALTGLADDDHTQYLLADGSRAGSTTSVQSFGATGIATTRIESATATTIFFDDDIRVGTTSKRVDILSGRLTVMTDSLEEDENGALAVYADNPESSFSAALYAEMQSGSNVAAYFVADSGTALKISNDSTTNATLHIDSTGSSPGIRIGRDATGDAVRIDNGDFRFSEGYKLYWSYGTDEPGKVIANRDANGATTFEVISHPTASATDDSSIASLNAFNGDDSEYAKVEAISDEGIKFTYTGTATRTYTFADTVDVGSVRVTSVANATADTDALNRITADGRYLQDAPSDGSEYVRKNAAWVVASGAGGTSDHGALSGLSDDDHTQYHNDTRGDARYYTKSQMDTSLSGKEDSFTKNTGFNKNLGTTSGTVSEGNHTHSNYLTDAASNGTIYGRKDGAWAAVPSGGVTDHGALTGLGDDDHTQYHNDTRGDARYYTKSQMDTSLSGKEDSFTKNTGFNKAFGTTSGTVSEGNHTHSSYLTDAPSDGSEYVRKNGAWAVASSGGGTSDHGSLTGLGDDDHTQYLLASGSRTGGTSGDQEFTNSVKAAGYKTGSYTGMDVTFRAYLGTTATDFYVHKGLITGHS